MVDLQELKSQFRLFWYIYNLELRRLFAYRTDFWLSFLGNLSANLIIAFALFNAIFSEHSSPSIAGFGKEGILLYYLLVPLVENMTRLSTKSGGVSHEIYRGTLTRYLVYPTSFFLYRMSQTLASFSLAFLQTLVVLGCFVLWNPHQFGGFEVLGWFALGVMTCLAATLLNLILVSTLEMAAFWAEQIWTLTVMLMFAARLLGGALLPLSFFSLEAQSILALLPFSYLISFPILVMLGKISIIAWAKGIAVMATWTALAALCANMVWKRGLLRYSGVGQ